MLDFTVKQLLGNNVHLGHSKKLRSSSMERFLFGYRHNYCIINTHYTSFMLRRALNFIKGVAMDRGIIMFCGIEKFIGDVEEPAVFVKKRWIGGVLTNLHQSFNVLLGTELLEEGFLPSAIVLLGEDRNKYNILNEANHLGIPSIALVDSDMISFMPMYSIVSNNDMFSTVRFFFGLFRRAIAWGYIEEEIRIDEELQRKKRRAAHYRS